MSTHSCLKIAERMNALLQHELGQGVDGLRMVADPLYARDVLLVCDAMPGTELAQLARQFRAEATEKAQPQAAPSPPAAGAGRDRADVGARQGRRGRTREDSRNDTRHGANPAADADAASSSAFGSSIWSRIASGFGLTTPGGPSSPDLQPEADPGAAAPPPQGRWFSPSRRRAGKQ